MQILVEEVSFGISPVPEMSSKKLMEWAKGRRVCVCPNLGRGHGLATWRRRPGWYHAPYDHLA
jgi:hypothetical protein